VINFDVPLIYEDYVHRIGRTGRAEQVGESITFITLAEMYHWHKIEDIIQQKIEPQPLPEGVLIEETPFFEQQDMLRSVDEQRKREDPEFKGAFHDKKWVIKARANGNKAALKTLGKNGITRSGAVAQGEKKAPSKMTTKAPPKGPDRNNRPGKNAKYRGGAPSFKKKR
jgi:ATP-dependent RNA helicase RhlE